jgi:hypothetical protein
VPGASGGDAFGLRRPGRAERRPGVPARRGRRRRVEVIGLCRRPHSGCRGICSARLEGLSQADHDPLLHDVAGTQLEGLAETDTRSRRVYGRDR